MVFTCEPQLVVGELQMPLPVTAGAEQQVATADAPLPVVWKRAQARRRRQIYAGTDGSASRRRRGGSSQGRQGRQEQRQHALDGTPPSLFSAIRIPYVSQSWPTAGILAQSLRI
eukprot:COSAG02_NODE_34188_length_488_cov_0.915167_1_plen_114_part_00